MTTGNIPSAEITAAMDQIIFYYNLLPDEWKKKAYWIFEKLWNKKQVVISTSPRQVQQVYEPKFDDLKEEQLYKKMSDQDAALFLLGREIKQLIERGLHGPAESKKEDVLARYGSRGLNFVNIITTEDLRILIDELPDTFDDIIASQKLNEWLEHYSELSLLISPEHLEDAESVEQKILQAAQKLRRTYLLVNISGDDTTILKMQTLVHNLKEKEKLAFKDLQPSIRQSGFRKSLKIKIDF